MGRRTEGEGRREGPPGRGAGSARHPPLAPRPSALPLALRPLSFALVALLLAGCATPAGEDGLFRPGTPPPPTPLGPALVFGGVVRDAVTNETIRDATVRIDLAQALPCGRQGIGWTSWETDRENGSFGPIEVPRPRSDEVAFFLHAKAPGYSANATFIGPQQARSDLGNLTVILHPNATLQGTAPPGTLLALDAPIFPRVAVAGADGNFSFPNARAVAAKLVAGTDVPYETLVTPPARVDVPDIEARGWTLEGRVKGPTGAPVAADIVAWNGSALASVARTSASGAFALPLAPEPQTLRIEARTSDNQYGGVLQIEVKGPPALRETVLVKPLC